MSKKKEFEESFDNEEKAIDESIKLIRDQVDRVPFLNERKMEINANRLLIQNAKDEEVDELYSKLLPIQKSDEQNFMNFRLKLSEVKFVFNVTTNSTSGTASVFQNFEYEVRRESSLPIMSSNVISAYKEVADYKSHKVEIPKRLDQLHDGLGTMFSLVHDNVDKAKNKVIIVKDAVSDMRDVLNQLWANLADRAEKSSPEKWRSITNKQFKKKSHHKIVAECLIQVPFNRAKFELLLNNMYELYGEMSDTSIGKNPLSQDYQKLDEFYSRWVNQIDG